MDTKSTKNPNKTFAALSLFLVPLLIILGLSFFRNHAPLEVIRYFVFHDQPSYTTTKPTESYHAAWAQNAFYSLEEDILGLESDTYSGYYRNHSAHMFYYAKNLKTGKVITNTETQTYDGEMTMEEFSMICNQSDLIGYFSHFDGSVFTFYDRSSYPFEETTGEFDNKHPINRFEQSDWKKYNLKYREIEDTYRNTYEIAFAFRLNYAQGEAITETHYYTDAEMRNHLGYVMFGSVIILLGLLLLVFRFINRGGRQELAKIVAKPLHFIPLEFKLLVGLLLLIVVYETMGYASYDYFSPDFLAVCTGIYFYVYLFSVDVCENKKECLYKSICYWSYTKIKKRSGKEKREQKLGFVSKTYRRMKKGIRSVQKREKERILSLPYQKRMHRTLIKYVLGMFVVFLLSAFLWRGLYILVIPLAAGGMTALSYWFYKRYVGIMEDIERIAQHIRYLRSGGFDQKLFLSPDSQLLPLAENLNNLQDGLKNEIDKRMVSEKMKVELITNVSHDLKTPLTSMINYIDLMKEENLQPEHVNAYVKVLDDKSKRLKSLIENIFDISKATSGNMVVNYNKLSMAELINQTLAECENRLELSKLSVKKNFTDEKFYVNADGKMLWRVTENIINNAVKYSMQGTRIYLELTEGKEFVCFTVKNIAGYEMNFTADSIVERFVRGDESRTTDGTGLGLSIVKSFTEAMGGKMNINIDGDLFKISVCIKRYQNPNPETQN